MLYYNLKDEEFAGLGVSVVYLRLFLINLMYLFVLCTLVLKLKIIFS